MRNRSVTIDFDRHQPLSGGNGRFRPSSVDFRRYQSREGERRGGRKIPGVLSARVIRRSWAISSPTGSFFSLRGEKKSLPAWGERMRRLGSKRMPCMQQEGNSNSERASEGLIGFSNKP
ncbi:hypothetical protein BHM03_00040145 [Ensete ventricosum]|nr:hypothetical protein BHM03_00040145 [Ensete ventricosum]